APAHSSQGGNSMGLFRRKADKELIAQLEARLAETEEGLRAVGQRYQNARSLLAQVRGENDALEALLAQAHFRNPETGRLGRKGQVFGRAAVRPWEGTGQ